ncbi:MAG: hypothetical protein AAF004_00965 [Pseudomonadota bacterium]
MSASGDQHAHPIVGVVCIVLGCFPLAIATGLMQAQPGTIHAPLWVVGLVGVIAIVAGVMVMLPTGRVLDAVACLLCAGFAAVGFWLSLKAPADGFSGGLPFISSGANVMVARVIFGSGAVMSLIMAVYAAKRALKSRS